MNVRWRSLLAYMPTYLTALQSADQHPRLLRISPSELRFLNVFLRMRLSVLSFISIYFVGFDVAID